MSSPSPNPRRMALFLMAAFLPCLLVADLIPLPTPLLPGQDVSGWPYAANGTLFSSPAVGPQGQVVFGTYSGYDETDADGSVYCLNPDGTLRWRFDGVDWFDSSPAIGPDGTVYIGCWDNYLYALDAHSLKFGPTAYLWRFPTNSAISATPTIGPDGTLYVGSLDGFMYAVWPDGTERWVFGEVDEDFSPISGQAILDRTGNVLYFGSDAGILYAVDAATGDMIWSFQVPPNHDFDPENPARAIFGSPVLSENGELYFTCENGMLYEVDRSDGTLVNYFPASDSILSSPVVGRGGEIYMAASDGFLYCIITDPDFEIMISLWEVFVGDVFYSTPTLDDDNNILVAAFDGDASANTTAITSIAPDGSVNWTRQVASLIDASPNINPDGSILIGDYDGKLYKLVGEAPLSWDHWPRFGSNMRQTGFVGDLGHPELVDYFPDIESISQFQVFFGEELDFGAFVEWFGGAYLRAIELPEIEHQQHGLLYMAESGPDGVIYWDKQLREWVFAPKAAPDHYLLLDEQQWIFHARPTVQPDRWYYDLQEQTWTAESGL